MEQRCLQNQGPLALLYSHAYFKAAEESDSLTSLTFDARPVSVSSKLKDRVSTALL